MTGWNENNFLERLMPLSHRGYEADPVSCPDAQTFCAALDEGPGSRMWEVVSGHLHHCPECAELYSRLLSFQATSESGDAEWKITEKRLDNWMESALRQRSPLGRVGAPKPPYFEGAKIWEFISSWKTQLALASTAVIVLAVYLVRLGTHVPSPVRSPARATTPANEVQIAESPGQEVRPKEPARPVAKPSKPHAQPVPTGAIKTTPAETANSSSATVPAQPPASSTEPSSANANPEMMAQQAPAQQEQMPPVGPPSRTAAKLPPSRNLPPASRASGVARLASPSPAFFPSSIHLAAGTRVWIRVLSTSPLPDGSLSFKGSVLLAVTQNNGVVIENGAQASGSILTAGGRKALFVSEFTVRDIRYVLKGAGGAIEAQSPGAGPYVEFDSGQRLEMFLSTDSLYPQVGNYQGPRVERPSVLAEPQPPK